MLQILGYIFLIAIGFLVVKFGIFLIMRCCIIGIIAFLCVGMITGALAILGMMSSDTAWTLSKWAFYIGTAVNIVEVIFHPFRAISDAWDVTIDDDFSGPSSSSSSSSSYSSYSSYRDDDDDDEYKGVRCCGNCRWNNSLFGNNVICNHNPAGSYNGVMDRCSDYLHK